MQDKPSEPKSPKVESPNNKSKDSTLDTGQMIVEALKEALEKIESGTIQENPRG